MITSFSNKYWRWHANSICSICFIQLKNMTNLTLANSIFSFVLQKSGHFILSSNSFNAVLQNITIEKYKINIFYEEI